MAPLLECNKSDYESDLVSAVLHRPTFCIEQLMWAVTFNMLSEKALHIFYKIMYIKWYKMM